MKMRVEFLLLGLLGFSGCANRLFYQPERFMRPPPETRGIRTEAVTLSTRDGEQLAAWWLPAGEPARGVVVHFHGNAQNMSTHVRFAEWLPAEGYHLLVFDYRGYGGSTGLPDRRGLVLDGMAALAWAAERVENPAEDLLVWGQSLGAGVALQALLHSEIPVRAVLVDSAFYSHTRIGADVMKKLPWFLQPLRLFRPLLISSGLDARDAVPRLGDTPVFFLHGGADAVIPYRHSVDLRARARGPAQLWIVPGAGHCDAVLRFPEEVRPRLLRFLEAPHQVPLPLEN